jgi:hypothetical protein
VPLGGCILVAHGTVASGQTVSELQVRGPVAMKKLLLVAVVAAGGLLVYRQMQADKAEQNLWTEATDPVPVNTQN